MDVEIVSGSPMKSSYSVLEDALPGQTVLMGCGEKDTYYSPEALAKYTPEGVTARAEACPNIVDPNTKNPYSATAVRDTIKNNDFEAFAKFLPDRSLQSGEEIFSLLGGNLQEMASMGGGGVVGTAGEVGSEKMKKTHEKNFRPEEGLVNEVMDYLLGISVG